MTQQRPWRRDRDQPPAGGGGADRAGPRAGRAAALPAGYAPGRRAASEHGAGPPASWRTAGSLHSIAGPDGHQRPDDQIADHPETGSAGTTACPVRSRTSQTARPPMPPTRSIKRRNPRRWSRCDALLACRPPAPRRQPAPAQAQHERRKSVCRDGPSKSTVAEVTLPWVVDVRPRTLASYTRHPLLDRPALSS